MISETLISRAVAPDFTQALQTGVGATTRSASEHQGQPDFGDLLRSTIGQVDRLEKQAQVAVQGLMSGTGIVPGDDFTLQHRDVIRISIDGIGVLENPVG